MDKYNATDATLTYLLAKAQQRQTEVWIFTCDSHDHFGPFADDAAAHSFATQRGLSSYQLCSWDELPQLTRERSEAEMADIMAEAEELDAYYRFHWLGEHS